MKIKINTIIIYVSVYLIFFLIADILFSNFTKERVQKELEEFLEFNFMDRCGGGIGVTRMIRALKLSNILH